MTQYLSREDVSRILGVSVSTIGRIIACGELEAIRVGHQVRISPAALERFIAGHNAKDCNNEQHYSNANV